MIALLRLFRGMAQEVRTSEHLDILCPSWNGEAPRPRSFGCRSTFVGRHACMGHETGRPDYMHRCECGRRWAE